MKDINVRLGERIKFTRKEKGLTRERLAELIEVSPRFLAEVECGKVGVSLQTLKNISLSLLVSTDYLLGLDNEYSVSQLEIFNNQLKKVDEKFYPLIFNILNQLEQLN